MIIGLLAIGIIYIYRTQESPRPTPPITPFVSEPPTSDVKHSRSLKSLSAPSISTDSKVPDKKNPFSPTSLKSPKSAQLKRDVSTEKLQKRIVQLEKQVESLHKQLAEESFPETELPSEPTSSFAIKEEQVEDEEHSELAIQQLLETLDEKLAKRAISKQLYNLLRDKYLARLEKTKHRLESSKQRGTRETHTGEK